MLLVKRRKGLVSNLLRLPSKHHLRGVVLLLKSKNWKPSLNRVSRKILKLIRKDSMSQSLQVNQKELRTRDLPQVEQLMIPLKVLQERRT
jgi:hypothetical protein